MPSGIAHGLLPAKAVQPSSLAPVGRICAAKKLGLLIIDEEHDAAFVQQDGLRYSLAMSPLRGQLEQCPWF